VSPVKYDLGFYLRRRQVISSELASIERLSQTLRMPEVATVLVLTLAAGVCVLKNIPRRVLIFMFTECTVISAVGLSLSGTVLHSLSSLGEGSDLTKEKTTDCLKIEDRMRRARRGVGGTGNSKNKSGTMGYKIDG
jgi:hypothetical protein